MYNFAQKAGAVKELNPSSKEYVTDAKENRNLKD